MITALTIFHVIISLVLIVIVLIQSGKGQGIGAGLGGASAAAQKMFGGGQTQSALGKATIGVAALFMATSLLLAYFSSQPQSAMDLQKGGERQTNETGSIVEVNSDNTPSGGDSADNGDSEQKIEVQPSDGAGDSADDSSGSEAADDPSGASIGSADDEGGQETDSDESGDN